MSERKHAISNDQKTIGSSSKSPSHKKVRISSPTPSESDILYPRKKRSSPSPPGTPTEGILNPHYITPEFIRKFRQAFRYSKDFNDPLTGCQVHSNPFPSAVLPHVFSSLFLQHVKKEVVAESFTHRSNDLYEFYQSRSLENVDKPYLAKLKQVVYSDWFSRLFGELTGIELDGETIDLSAHIYKQGNYLLCHDDDIKEDYQNEEEYEESNRFIGKNNGISGRRIAFIIYLVDEDWTKEDGGALELFDIDKKGHPHQVVHSIVPRWNSMAFFEVSPTSYHQVSEVITTVKPRISISGWFHGSLKSRLSIAEYQILDDMDAEEFDITDLINSEYLKEDSIEEFLKMIHTNGSVELRGFLKEEVYARLMQSFEEEAHWEEEPIGSPFVRKYHLLKNQNNTNHLIAGKQSASDSSPYHVYIHNFFKSNAFRNYIENVTHLSFGAVAAETRQFRCGNYIIAHDHAADRAGVDVVFCCISEKWDEEWEGSTVYFAENKEMPLHTLWPVRNTLMITERIDGIHRFVKYINSKAQIPRTEMAFMWVTENEENEGDEEDESDILLENGEIDED
ncbi:hypothetical protein G9A89_022978 [Geosiphon pyriformis]|nr:hypothetical protein G9A89_022978 [Geosiphon pyriformis]